MAPPIEPGVSPGTSLAASVSTCELVKSEAMVVSRRWIEAGAVITPASTSMTIVAVAL